MTSTIDAPVLPGPREGAPSTPKPPGTPIAPESTGPESTGPESGAAAGRPAPVLVRRLTTWDAPAAPVPITAPAQAGAPARVTDGPPEPQTPPPGTRAEVSVVLRLVMEMLDGRRPPGQLGGRLSPSVQRYVAAAATRLKPAPARAGTLRGRHGPPGLRSVRLCHPTVEVAEVSAVWRHQGRFRALAARFQCSDGRWRCTALRLG